jgi:hypothetical protein
MMRWSIWLLWAGLAACSHSTDPNSGVLHGWRDAGLVSADPNGTGQFANIIAVGSRLFVLDGKGGVWGSSSYSMGWSQLAVPAQGGVINRWATDGTNLYVGTLRPGKVFRYAPGPNTWTDLGLPDMDTSDVYGIAWFQGHVTASRDNYTTVQIKILNDTGWQDWSDGYSGGDPYRFFAAGDTLWAPTYENDPWYRVWGEPSWKQLPSLKHPSWGGPNDSDSHPRGIASYNGNIWIGWYSGQMAMLNASAGTYQRYQNCLNGQTGCKDIPLNIYTVVSYANHLFVGGFWPASGFVFDDSLGKFLPMADGWCWDNNNLCGGTTVWNFAGIGDTLYAAGNARIMKYPLSQLPVATAANVALWNWPPDSVKTVP